MTTPAGSLGSWLCCYVRSSEAMPDERLVALLLELPPATFVRLVAEASMANPAGELLALAADLVAAETGR